VNRLERFTTMHPSTQDLERDPAPPVGTYDTGHNPEKAHISTIGERVINTAATSMQDKALRYEKGVGGSTACWRTRSTLGFWNMPRKQLDAYEQARATAKWTR